MKNIIISINYELANLKLRSAVKDVILMRRMPKSSFVGIEKTSFGTYIYNQIFCTFLPIKKAKGLSGKFFTVLLIFIFTTSSDFLISQHQYGSIKGSIKDTTGKSLVGISIIIEGSDQGAASDLNGTYLIERVKPGSYKLKFSAVGYKNKFVSAIVNPTEVTTLNITLSEAAVEMDEVIVKGKSEAQELREQGYSVEVIESKRLKNLSKDINQLLKTTPGINLREAGGLGSGFKLSLNGLSGNQIRYFIDGVPMENFGSSLSLNNYPVNLIEKLEVYKGVVPISLGSDALGGAVNIVTDHWQTSFLDAAYSYGSFNTSRASLNGQYANNNNGIFLKGSFFYNHSDNNYRVENAPVYDVNLGNLISTKKVKRFHDDYTSVMLNTEAGLFNVPFADKLSVRMIASKGRKNYQHPDNNINRVFGDFHTNNNSLLFSVNYKKAISNLSVKAYALAGNIDESVIDTSSRKYNWNGDFLERDAGDPKGELLERRSFMEMSDAVIRSNVGLDYSIMNNHSISINFTQNYLERTGNDKVDEFNRSYESPNYINKNMLGGAYNLHSLNKLVDAAVFVKQYWYSGKIITFDYNDSELISEPSLTKTGYGISVSYQLSNQFLVKTSFEKAYRIPESFEILGDGIYVNPNPLLQPERSYNVNLGYMLTKRLSTFDLRSEANFFYRKSENFIRFSPLGPFGQYENLNNVGTRGLEASVDVNFIDLISVSTNLTYQDITDQTEFDEGLQNKNYKSRVPNIPYFFSNAAIGYTPNRNSSERIAFYFNLRYVHEFYLMWENLGNKNEKNIIPSQITQDVQIEYSMYDGMYNISFSVLNIFDKLVYDNFNIQKPGRSYNIKLRYFIR